MSKIRVFLEFWKSVSAYVEGSKNFSKFSLFVAGRLLIWLIFRDLVAFWRELVRMRGIQLEAGVTEKEIRIS